MMRAMIITLAVGLASSAARAQEAPGVLVRLEPYTRARPPSAPPDPASRYLYLLELTPAAWPSAEVVADRRLLRFEVHPEGSRRRLRCSHPDAPRSVSEERVKRIGAGAEDRTWREWIDLRMYCWGRALRALDDGARVTVTYGFPRRGRNRWVARRVTGEDETRIVEGTELSFAPRPAPAPPEGSVRIELAPRDARSGSALSFSVAIRANEGSHRVYVRDDLFSFTVDGPLGRTTCSVERETIVPIIDFYTRVRGRRAARTSIAASRWCPEGTFDVAGVYDVSPVVDLIYGGERYGIEVVTGRIEGPPVPIRIRRGGHGYIEHVPEPAPPARSARGPA